MSFDVDLSKRHTVFIPKDEDHACLTGVIREYPKDSRAYLNHRNRVISTLSSMKGRERIKALTVGAAGVRSLFFIRLFKNIQSIVVDSPFVVDFKDVSGMGIKHFFLRRRSSGLRDIRPVLSLDLETIALNPENNEYALLGGFKFLKFAEIINSPICDYSFLNGEMLTEIKISGSRSSAISGLSERVVNVQIAYCAKLKSIAARHVRALVINCCRSFEYECVGKMHNLEFLSIEDSHTMKNLQFVQSCKNLKRIDIISRNEVSDLGPLRDLRNLKVICIVKNKKTNDMIKSYAKDNDVLITNDCVAFNCGLEIPVSTFDQVCTQLGFPGARAYRSDSSSGF